MMRQSARMALARYSSPVPTAAVSFMILLVTMMTSSASLLSSLMMR